MTIQLNIYIVKWLDNCVYSNDYTIDYIHSQITIELSIFKWLYNWHIHSQMTIQLTLLAIYIGSIHLTIYNSQMTIEVSIFKWLYNWLYT